MYLKPRYRRTKPQSIHHFSVGTMMHLILLISSACLLHVGHSGPTCSGGDGGSLAHSAYGSAVHAPVGYHGPIAKPHVLSDGHIADTPEVAAAKHQHYSAIQKAQAEAAAHGYSGDDGSYGSGRLYASSHGSGRAGGSSYGSGAGYSGGYSYSGPLAYPKVLPSGLLADTHEVAAAKHAHWNAVAITSREHADKWANNYSH